jgi:Na+-transporting NADH:ubiquinone oxidoreductase subunit C
MNKNSNIYQILYAAVMVLLVGSVLALIYMALKPKQDENIANDTRKQILSALHVPAPDDSQVKATYEKYVIQDLLVDTQGNITDSAQNVAFDVEMKKNVKAAERKLPVMKCKMEDGSIKYVLPVYGAGLWGPIWGYVAVNDDGNTIFGANFSHEGETPGLGARIAEEEFQGLFVDKHLFKDGEFKNVVVLKKGQKSTTGAEVIDALTGATITSQGVSAMLEDCLAPYKGFLMKLQGTAPAVAPESEINENQPE